MRSKIFLISLIICALSLPANAADSHIIENDVFSISLPASWAVEDNNRQNTYYNGISDRIILAKPHDGNSPYSFPQINIQYIILSPQADPKQAKEFEDSKNSAGGLEKIIQSDKLKSSNLNTSAIKNIKFPKGVLQTADIDMMSENDNGTEKSPICTFMRQYKSANAMIYFGLVDKGTCSSEHKEVQSILKSFSIK